MINPNEEILDKAGVKKGIDFKERLELELRARSEKHPLHHSNWY
jgi:hypothetical protein